MPRSATSRALTRPARPTYCCTTLWRGQRQRALGTRPGRHGRGKRCDRGGSARPRVEITTGAEVIAVRVKGGRVASVALADGTEIEADAVAGAVNPKLLYLEMLEPGALDPEFRSRIERWRCASEASAMNVALSELPDFTSAPGSTPSRTTAPASSSAPSLRYMERAYFDARTHGWASDPIVEMLIPSTGIPRSRPRESTVASLFCQHFDPVLPGGRSWDARQRTRRRRRRRYGQPPCAELQGEHPRPENPLAARPRARLRLDRRRHLPRRADPRPAFLRPPGARLRDYRSPVRGLYLCGSGAHPGGGVYRSTRSTNAARKSSGTSAAAERRSWKAVTAVRCRANGSKVSGNPDTRSHGGAPRAGISGEARRAPSTSPPGASTPHVGHRTVTVDARRS